MKISIHIMSLCHKHKKVQRNINHKFYEPFISRSMINFLTMLFREQKWWAH